MVIYTVYKKRNKNGTQILTLHLLPQPSDPSSQDVAAICTLFIDIIYLFYSTYRTQ